MTSRVYFTLSIILATSAILSACSQPASLTTTKAIPSTTAPASTLTASPFLTSSSTPLSTPIPETTTTSEASRSEAATPAPVDRLLDWQALLWPNHPQRQPWAFDGTWLVTIHKSGGTEDAPTFALYTRRITDGPDSVPAAVFQIPEGYYPQPFETGSGLETAGGRAAVLLTPFGGDDPHGYELMLIDLESGSQRLFRHSDRALLPAFPAIAMSADWLALKDLNAEGKDCIEVFHLPEGETRRVICPPAAYPDARVQWPALGDKSLAYIQYETANPCASVHRFDLVTGQDSVFEYQACQVGLAVSISDHMIVWAAVSSSGTVSLQGDADGQPFELERSRWGMPQVCGRKVYFLAENQGALELRAWQPGLAQEVLHRFRPMTEITAGPLSNDPTLPKYNVLDWRCGSGWILFFTGDIYAARE